MGKFFKKIPQYFFPLLLVSILFLVIFQNYVPGTWLSGWDTLHPEFNLGLYLKRIFWGVWQPHQGFGAVGSQAHIAELPRLLVVWLLSLTLPVLMVRYAFFALTLLSGGLGIYFLCKYLLARETSSSINAASFLAAIFYVFNLATLQHYYVPLEMFAVHFGSLPWLIFLVIRYLRHGKKVDLILFSLVTIFSSAMAHTATLFYVYFAALGLYLITVWLLVRRKNTLKRIVVIMVTTLALNLFWLAPNIYYIVNHSKEVSQSRISSIFSNEAFLQGKGFGNLQDLGLLKNFLFNWREFSVSQNTYVDLMDEWQIHLGEWGVKEIAYTFFGLSLVGLVIALARKSKYALGLIPVLGVSVFFWINANPPFTKIFEYLRNIDLLREGLRFPFTKISILLILCLAVFLAFSFQIILELVKKIRLRWLIFLVILGANVYLMLPAFKGNLFSPSMKVSIPENYFQMFAWFQTKDPNFRVAKLPLNTMWGWNFYSWDYQGAGFTWFGIPQPTLDREFDRWSALNETFYNQLAPAAYAEDLKTVEETLQKYQVKYLLLDESILNAGGSPNYLYIPQIKNLLAASSHIKTAANFGFLTVHETDWDLGSGGITVSQTYTRINTDLTYAPQDPVYPLIGNYYEKEGGATFPYANFDPRGRVTIKEEGLNIVFRNGDVVASFPAVGKISEDFGQKRGFSEAFNCDLKKIGEVSKDDDGAKITYTARNGGVSCDFFTFDNLKYQEGYVLRVKGENKEGRSLKIYLFNQETGRMDLEELMPDGVFDQYFVVYPKGVEGSGYSLNLETRSFGKVPAENILEKIEFIPAPIAWLTSLKGEGSGVNPETNNLTIIRQQQIAPYLYKIDVRGGGLIQLGQGYEKGWVAFSKQPEILKTLQSKLSHVRVNSWANGWIISEGSSQIIIIFWPQLLEFGGMVIGIIFLGSVLFCRHKKVSSFVEN